MKLILVMLFSSLLTMTAGAADNFSGSWTYRSFHNNPEFVGNNPATIAGLLFGEGNLQILVDANDVISGTVSFGADYVLDITGTRQPGEDLAPDFVTMKGVGRAGTPTAGWIYEYKAFPAPKWDNAINQRPSLVGTVVRTRHEPAPAGYTASFIMVRQ